MKNRLLPGSVVALLAAGACVGANKSSNPLSPTVSGPIPGVSISAPGPTSPDNAARIAVEQQPVTLTVVNANTSGVRPLNYLIEIALDTNFTNKIFSRDGITPSDGGRTSVQLPNALAPERSYYWHARAQDGANVGDFSAMRTFAVYTPIVIGRPTPVSPANGTTTTNTRPTFVIGNAPHSGPAGAITYTVQLADSESFGNILGSWTVGEQPNQTTVLVPNELAAGKQIFWHARASDPTTTGAFSDAAVFKTPAAPAPPPPTGGGGGGGGGGTTCTFTGSGPTSDNSCFITEAKAQLQAAGRDLSGDCGAWSIIDRAVRNMGHGAGYKVKAGTSCNGYSIKSVMFPDGADFLVLISPGTTNGPTWTFFAYSDPGIYAAPK
ncbi:MAG TPA: hypothetical protein VKH42_17995 [Vicinamibacterales bacterium]|nr:hypothetical protein [Vicinamibacterales bacterium]